MGARTIYLLQTVGGQWLIRVAADHQTIIAEQHLASATAAIRAFVIEGRHQCYAHMVIIIEGQRPITIRAGKKPLEHDDEPAQLARIREAMKAT